MIHIFRIRRKDEVFARRWCFFLACFFFFLLIYWRIEIDKIFEPMVAPVYSVVEATPTPTPSLAEEIEKFGQELFKKDWPLFKKIIICESGFDPGADNGHDFGLAQVNAKIHGIRKDWLKDWRVNLTVAYKLWREQGWNPWLSSQKCWLK